MSIPDSEAKKKWDKENAVFVSLRLMKKSDADILQKMENVPNKQAYIKAAIRKTMEQEQ